VTPALISQGARVFDSLNSHPETPLLGGRTTEPAEDSVSPKLLEEDAMEIQGKTKVRRSFEETRMQEWYL
jgi:hypothetical protein